MTLLRTVLLAGCLLLPLALAGCAETTNGDDDNGQPATAAGVCTSTLDGSKNATEPVVTLATTMGDIRLTLYCDKAPVTTQHIVKLVESGCWDGTRFHRVVAGFMNQGGDPLSKDEANQARWGQGGPADCGVSPDTIPEEYYCVDGTISTDTPATQAQPANQCDAHGGLGLKHDGVGVWSMARTSQPHTSGSQFFLTAGDASFLDGRYTVFGHTADEASDAVVLEINQLTCNGQRCQDPNSRTDTPVVVESATIAWS